jgi:hypothetical protein
LWVKMKGMDRERGVVYSAGSQKGAISRVFMRKSGRFVEYVPAIERIQLEQDTSNRSEKINGCGATRKFRLVSLAKMGLYLNWVQFLSVNSLSSLSRLKPSELTTDPMGRKVSER